jgi:putative tricarboxylic transport membrane protein
MDMAARTIKQLLEGANLISSRSVVINKPGAGGSIAYQYIDQSSGNGWRLALASPGLITNKIMGIGDVGLEDVTPICTMFSENIVFMVRADSSIQDGNSLISKLRNNPASISFGIATALGGANHIAAASLLKAAGIDPNSAFNVLYKAGSDALIGLLRGEVDVVPVAAPVALPQMTAGQIRVLAVSSPVRLGGAFATVPTWTELGVNTVYASWRAIVAPRGANEKDISAAAVAFKKIATMSEWQTEVEQNFWISKFLGADATKTFFDDQWTMHSQLLSQLGLAK